MKILHAMSIQKRATVAAVLGLCLCSLSAKAGPLTGVKTIQVDATEVSNSDKVKEA
jgi:hypothetical protein